MAPKYHPTPLSGGDRKALGKELGKARAMVNILATQSAEIRAKGEVLIQQADKLLCESWNERMWSDGDSPPRLLRRHLDQLDLRPQDQGRRDHQRHLRVPDDGRERGGRRHPPEGDAGDPDDAGRS